VAQKKVASWHSFQIFTLGIVNPSLDRLALEASTFLEDRGHIAYPFPTNSPHIIKPTPEYPGGPGDISHKHVAVACGLGELGWHTMLLTPEFGTRQKITTILTTASLTPDAIMAQGDLCDPEACGYQCAHACPTAAIPKAKTEEDTLKVSMDGARMAYGKLVGWRCRWGCSGMLKSTGGYKNIRMPKEEPTEEELLKYKAQMDPWQVREHTKSYAGLVPYCGKCMVVCPVKRGKRPFEKRFEDTEA
jgi:ferredoxin